MPPPLLGPPVTARRPEPKLFGHGGVAPVQSRHSAAFAPHVAPAVQWINSDTQSAQQ